MEQDAKIIDLPKFLDARGNLSFVEEFKHVPFKIKRVYWIYDVPGGETRGGHAYNENQEFIIALSGSFDVILDDRKENEDIDIVIGVDDWHSDGLQGTDNCIKSIGMDGTGRG